MTPPAHRLSADFLQHSERQIFHILSQPGRGEAHGAVLFLHPFAEEMHKARRTVAAQARLLAAQGYLVMQIDLNGCGDSDGEFVDARWETWLEDANAALDYLRQHCAGPITLWGLRLGALLACELERTHTDIQRLVLWQPVLNGEQQVDQFLRLRVAAAAVGERPSFDRKTLWSELREGKTLEVAGYELSAELAMAISKSRLHDLIPSCEVLWMEVTPGTGRELALPSRNVTAYWEDHGVQVQAYALPGEAFWRNHDAAINPDLLRLTLDGLR